MHAKDYIFINRIGPCLGCTHGRRELRRISGLAKFLNDLFLVIYTKILHLLIYTYFIDVTGLPCPYTTTKPGPMGSIHHDPLSMAMAVLTVMAKIKCCNCRI